MEQCCFPAPDLYFRSGCTFCYRSYLILFGHYCHYRKCNQNYPSHYCYCIGGHRLQVFCHKCHYYHACDQQYYHYHYRYESVCQHYSPTIKPARHHGQQPDSQLPAIPANGTTLANNNHNEIIYMNHTCNCCCHCNCSYFYLFHNILDPESLDCWQHCLICHRQCELFILNYSSTSFSYDYYYHQLLLLMFFCSFSILILAFSSVILLSEWHRNCQQLHLISFFAPKYQIIQKQSFRRSEIEFHFLSFTLSSVLMTVTYLNIINANESACTIVVADYSVYVDYVRIMPDIRHPVDILNRPVDNPQHQSNNDDELAMLVNIIHKHHHNNITSANIIISIMGPGFSTITTRQLQINLTFENISHSSGHSELSNTTMTDRLQCLAAVFLATSIRSHSANNVSSCSRYYYYRQNIIKNIENISQIRPLLSSLSFPLWWSFLLSIFYYYSTIALTVVKNRLWNGYHQQHHHFLSILFVPRFYCSNSKYCSSSLPLSSFSFLSSSTSSTSLLTASKVSSPHTYYYNHYHCHYNHYQNRMLWISMFILFVQILSVSCMLDALKALFILTGASTYLGILFFNFFAIFFSVFIIFRFL